MAQKMELWVELRALTGKFKDDVSKVTGNFSRGVSAGVFGGMSPKGVNVGGGVSGFVGKIIGQLGLIAGALNQITTLVTAAITFLAKSSGYLRSQLDIFGMAMSLFFKPFGDFLGVLLRPAVMSLMQTSIGFNRWIDSARLQIAALGRQGAEITIAAVKLYDSITKLQNEFLAQTLFNLGAWLTSVVGGVFDFKNWLENGIDKYFSKSLFNFSDWLLTNIGTFFTTDVFNFVTWIKETIGSMFGLNAPPKVETGGGATAGASTGLAEAIAQGTKSGVLPYIPLNQSASNAYPAAAAQEAAYIAAGKKAQPYVPPLTVIMNSVTISKEMDLARMMGTVSNLNTLTLRSRVA